MQSIDVPVVVDTWLRASSQHEVCKASGAGQNRTVKGAITTHFSSRIKLSIISPSFKTYMRSLLRRASNICGSTSERSAGMAFGPASSVFGEGDDRCDVCRSREEGRLVGGDTWADDAVSEAEVEVLLPVVGCKIDRGDCCVDDESILDVGSTK